MAKRIVITSIAIILLSLFCGTCFANEEMKTEINNLGNDVNNSLNMAGQEVRNVTDDVISGNIIGKTKDKLENVQNNLEYGTENVRNRIASDYNTTLTDAETTMMGTDGMISNNAWIWMVIAVLAVFIVSLVWFYVAQNNERKY